MSRSVGDVRSGATVAVTGPSGKTGRAVAAALAARGHTVRPVRRNDFADLPAALAGCDAAYVIAPNLHPREPELVAALLAGARAAGVARVTYHSVVAPYAPSMPHHLGKARSEDLVRRCGLSWSVLEPCAYVQNLLPALQTTDPALRVPYDVDAPFGLVDLVDVAECAAVVVADDTHAGATYELGGPALVSVRDVAREAGAVLGRPVLATRVEPSEWAAGPGAALDERERGWLTAMFAYYDGHGLPAGSLATASLLGRSATSVDAVLRRELAAHRPT